MKTGSLHQLSQRPKISLVKSDLRSDKDEFGCKCQQSFVTQDLLNVRGAFIALTVSRSYLIYAVLNYCN